MFQMFGLIPRPRYRQLNSENSTVTSPVAEMCHCSTALRTNCDPSEPVPLIWKVSQKPSVREFMFPPNQTVKWPV